ncbi:MAG: L-aspartate oxidase [Gammaproteobacteria bacterium]|nr:L-aspartate oxidase [Gammaproteobacteria bacterium]
MNSIKRTDILIAGTGLSGLAVALMLPEKFKVTLITKDKFDACSTAWAQGGIAAVSSTSDSFEKHFNDTLKNGHGLVNKDVAETIINEAPNAINWLIEKNIKFTKNHGSINLTLEGGHSERRIFHILDKTGKVIHNKLINEIKTKKNINIISNHQVIDLITTKANTGKSKECLGAYVFNQKEKYVETYISKKVILATGGASKLYQFTSNPKTSTGDGIAIAWRAGCKITNMEFVQFHPTCLYHANAKSFLISESLRGEGGKLLTPQKDSFMDKYDSRKELAPRDIVARAIDFEMKKYGFSHVLLDISHKPASFIKKRFPIIHKKCLSLGIDITRMPIPVVPASHYTCGGVQTHINGETEVKRLHVIGEAAHTGFHGANRLASNSLLECLVMAKECSENIKNISDVNFSHGINKLPKWDDSYVSESKENIVISHNWDELRKIMWSYVGIVRSDKRLFRAAQRIKIIENEVNEYYHKHKLTSDLLELRNIIEVSNLIIKSALIRKESRGLHYSEDYPLLNKKFEKNTYIQGKQNDYFLELITAKS